MLLKFFGAAFVVIACGSVGFRMASNHRKEENSLRQLVAVLDYLECELQCHLTPLPTLCRQAAKESPTILANVFSGLAAEMEAQFSPDFNSCMEAVLSKNTQLPAVTSTCLTLLGKSMGRYDLEGQRKGLEAVRQECRRQLEKLSTNRENRLRSYQTLGLCAGAALAILFV